MQSRDLPVTQVVLKTLQSSNSRLSCVHRYSLSTYFSCQINRVQKWQHVLFVILGYCFFNNLYLGLIGKTLLGSLWLVLNCLCNAASAQWGPGGAWDPWTCWKPHCAQMDKRVVKGHQKLQKLIIEMSNLWNPVTLPWLSASSDATICTRSTTKLWLSHHYPEPHLCSEKNYFASWQPCSLWQVTPWDVCSGFYILNNYCLTSPACVSLSEGSRGGFLISAP